MTQHSSNVSPTPLLLLIQRQLLSQLPLQEELSLDSTANPFLSLHFDLFDRNNNNRTRHNATQCFDVFTLHGQFGKSLPLVSSCIMAVLFGLIALWAFVSLCRLTIFKPRNRYFVFRSTRLWFYVCILLFCVGKVIFFGVGIAEKGYIALHTIPMDGKSWYLSGISNLCYHWASCFFYSAFCVLSIYWSQNLMFAYGMGESTVKSALAKSQRILIGLNVFLHLLQVTFMIVVSTMLIMGAVTGRSSAFFVLMSCNRIYQCVLVVSLMLFFLVWGLYVRSKMWNGFSVVHLANIYETKKVRNATALISFIIMVKLVWNLCLVVLDLSDWALCLDDFYLIISFVDFTADCIPIGIVVFLMAPSVHKRDSVESLSSSSSPSMLSASEYSSLFGSSSSAHARHERSTVNNDDSDVDTERLVVRKGYDSPITFERSLSADDDNTFSVDPVHRSFLMNRERRDSSYGTMYD